MASPNNLDPHYRAQIYAWHRAMKKKNPSYRGYDDRRRRYLEKYERSNQKTVEPNIPIGIDCAEYYDHL